MGAFTVRFPESKLLRLKSLARSRGTPQNQMIEEMTTLMPAAFDAEMRIQPRAKRGNAKTARGQELLKKAGS